MLADGRIVELTEQMRKSIEEHIMRMANNALRTLALAYKDDSD